MDNRVSVISIIIKEEESIGAVNELLHEFREYIVGRMGIPYRAVSYTHLDVYKRQEYEAADTYIVGIGTNDVLLPYLTRISWLWKLQMGPKCRRLQCKTDMKEFAVEYEKYLILLAKRQKKVILIGMPYIELKGYPHESIRIRNKIIGRLAKKYEVPFIDIYALQMELASQPGEYTWKHRNRCV